MDVVNGADLLGAPDGRFATVSGRLGQRLVLDRYLSILVGMRKVGFDSMRAALA